ncbi:MAG: UDP-3-O-(3-hydroxymyristoyl)glucosamine N-acyltransferase [Candidatus Omnitrophica bacterium]|nr:UDP-3-O-(3-hydroxymyristoyl)glucosamine N-acyltransferase [Candidatus Omnitrophota bacterium]
MKKSVREIAELIGAQVIGDPNIVITGIAGIKEAREGDITFLSSPKYSHFVNETKASAVIASQSLKGFSKPIIKADNPSLAFAKVASLFSPQKQILPKGVHPSAILGKDVKIGHDAAIGPYVVIEDGAAIGERCIINSGVFIGYDSVVGKDCLIYSNVSIREKTVIGDRVIIHNGTVIGSDGFGYDTKDGVHNKIPQVGCVIIEDDVEIGANVTIDRARFGKTTIGKGTKIDNLVHIAHNVVTGKNCIIVAQVGISGSTAIGNNVTLAGQAGIAGHLAIGDNVIVGAQAGVTKSIPANTFVSGYPAKPHKEATKINAYVQRLPQLNETVLELKKRLDKIGQAKNKDSKKNKPNGKSKNNKKRNRS